MCRGFGFLLPPALIIKSDLHIIGEWWMVYFTIHLIINRAINEIRTQ